MNAQSVAILCTILSLIAAITSAWCALLASRASKRASNRASTTSLRAEIDELRDAFEKNSVLLKRINQRAVMAERRAEPDPAGPSAGESTSAWKQRMRAQLLRPGQPVKHA
jgi:hypothetical protein